MTDTFAFVTDSHVGGDESGFWHQPRRPELLRDIFASLGELAREHDARLIVHGGDHVERATAAEIAEACGLMGAPGLPVAACMGNHDLATGYATIAWRAEAAKFARLTLADAVVPLAAADIILLNNIWLVDGRWDWHWQLGGPCRSELADEQLRWLAERLAESPDRPAAVVLHAALDAIPPEQTGLAGPEHAPAPPEYADRLNALLDEFPRVKLVLGGHNHANTIARHGGRLHVTATSLCEWPFEFRLVRIGGHSLSLRTVSALPAPAELTPRADKLWALGRPGDRAIDFTWA